MLARSEEELILFNQMDVDRYKKEQHIYSHFVHPNQEESTFFNYRLTQDNEVPDGVKAYTVNQQQEDEEVILYGRGNRNKKLINYNEDFMNDN